MIEMSQLKMEKCNEKEQLIGMNETFTKAS
jgi:hypothetical protein